MSLKQSLISEEDKTASSETLSLPTKRTSLNQINGQSFLSNIFFTWVFTLLRSGAKKQVKVEDLPKLTKQLSTQNQHNRFSNIFQQTQKSPKKGMTLIKVIMKTFWKQTLIILIIAILQVLVQMFAPYLTKIMMDFIANKKDYPSYQGMLLLLITIFSQIFRSIVQTHLSYRFTQLGINITNGITMLLYCKSLKFSPLANKRFAEGDIINYSQVDAQRIASACYQLSNLIISPMIIIVGLILMYFFIGVSFLSGILVIVLLFVFTYFLNKRTVKYNQKLLQAKDSRMRATQQMLDIIRFIKITIIQKFFFNKVDQKRSKQVQIYKKLAFLYSTNIFCFWLSTPLILSATFFTYILLGNQMNSSVAFTTMMIFSIIQYPIRMVPNAISELMQTYTSIVRIQKYLYAPQMNWSYIKNYFGPQQEKAIKIQGNFYWGKQKKQKDDTQKNKKDSNKQQKQKSEQTEDKIKKDQVDQEQSIYSEIQAQSLKDILIDYDEQQNQSQDKKPQYIHVLKDIDLNIQKGKFTLMLGDIGSGKSSILLAILNEMKAAKGSSIQINGSIAYASQKPWIMAGTVRQNIIFCLPYEKQRFQRAIHYAALEKDIELFPSGVQTQIGEKGVILSGGQKARVGLARALYSQKDIYLLDDILSAVDVHVGEFLMKQTLLGYLGSKTIIMPTHAVKYAQTAHQIIIMKKGRIVRKGNFRDIRNTPELEQILQKTNTNQNSQIQQNKQQNKATAELAMLKQAKINQKSQQKQQQKAVQDRIVAQLMLPQDHQVGTIDMKIFKEYIDLNGGMCKFVIPVVTYMVCWTTLTTMAAVILQRWCQDPIGQSYDLYIYIGVSIFSTVFIFARAYTLVISSMRQGIIVHRKMIKALLYASLTYFYNRIPMGRVINRLTKDLRQLDQAIGFAIGNFLVAFFVLVSSLIICIYGSTAFIFIPIAIVLFISYRVRLFYMKTQRQVSRFQKSTNSPVVTGFLSAISGLATIRAYQKQQNFIKKQFTSIDINKKVRLTKSGMQNWFSIALTSSGFLVNMTAIGYCLLSDNDNASLAGLLMNYALNLSFNIIQLTLKVSYFQTKVISLQRIYTFTKIQPEPAYDQYCLQWSPQQQFRQKPISKGKIQFKNLVAKYRSDLPQVLKGLHFCVQPGQKIGIVGRTGAGKTTLINVLLGITQISGGQILIDGKSFKDYHLKDIRNCITMIDQQPTLIKSTFRENLDLTNSHTDQDIFDILKQCNLYESVIDKGGLDSAVSNQSLSVGQKQLLCICRAFLKHSPIVLIDQATANIDTKNDSIIQNVIREKFKKCTVMTIAHRLSTLQHVDKILVMDGGKVLQYGHPSQLQKKQNGFYRQMVLKDAKQFLT